MWSHFDIMGMLGEQLLINRTPWTSSSGGSGSGKSFLVVIGHNLCKYYDNDYNTIN